MDSAKKIHATLGVFVLRLFPTMIQMILKDNITPGKLHRMFINKTLNTVLTDADIDLMKMLPNMDNFTIDLCYKILRFENLIDEPKCKWGNSPHDTDIEISDDIQRILNFSNEIVSKSSEEITKIFPSTFEENVKRIIERVDGYLKGDNCQQLYKNLHIQHIDTSELLNILEHLLQKHPITVIPSILKTDGKTMMRELYSRIAIVITDIFPDILRELILSRITPQNLYMKFDNAFLSSCYLKQQTDLKTSNLTNSFSCLDIPLIYKLLRYFSLIASPSKGWGKDPHPTDLLIADDVERIRMFRNDIAHRCDANINKNDCDAYFVTFSEIGERIDNHLTGQNSYKQNVIYCKTCVMDTQMQTKYENAAKELENLKLHYERKPFKFYWGDSFEQSLMDLRMMILNKELEGNEKFRVKIIMQIDSDTNRTVSILNSCRDEINSGLNGIDFVFAFPGSVVLCVDILVEEMETDEKLHLLLLSFMKKIIQTEGITVPSTEYVDVVLTHSEENTFFEITKKNTHTSSVVYLDFDIDASHFETNKKMEEALTDIVENVYMKSNGSGTQGDIKATVLPFQFDSNTDIIISKYKEVGQSIKENINIRGDPENSEVLVKYEKEEQDIKTRGDSEKSEVHVKYEKEEQEHIVAAQVAQEHSRAAQVAKNKHRCEPNCKGLDKDKQTLLLEPTDQHFVHLTKMLGIDDFYSFFIHLGMSKDDYDNLNFRYFSNPMDFMLMGMFQWRDKTESDQSPATIGKLLEALKAIDRQHYLCQIPREDHILFENAHSRLQDVPSDEVINTLTEKKLIGNCVVHLGIELGLPIVDIRKTMYTFPRDLNGQIHDLLIKWKKTGKVKPTIYRLMVALKLVEEAKGLAFLKRTYDVE